MQQLTPFELQAWLQDSSRPDPILLDVREDWEYAICHIAGSQLMPMSGFTSNYQTLDDEAQIVVICHHGMRSQQVGIFLEQQGFWHLYNLTGGIARWQHDVDPTMPVY
jgi:rhodanese-related sulfurtransferase